MKSPLKMLELTALTTVLTVLLYLHSSIASEAVMPPQEKPREFANQEGCYIDSLKRVIPYGKNYSPQDGISCMRYSCGKDGYMEIETCGQTMAGVGCVLVPGDLSKPFGECCDTVKCN